MSEQRVIKRFPSESACLQFLELIRWQGKPICPYCQLAFTTAAPKESRHHCNHCNTTFSVTVDTIFHGTRLPLQKWFLAICYVAESINKVSARRLAVVLRVNKNTAWRIASRIQNAELRERNFLEQIRKELL